MHGKLLMDRDLTAALLRLDHVRSVYSFSNIFTITVSRGAENIAAEVENIFAHFRQFNEYLRYSVEEVAEEYIQLEFNFN